MNQILIFTDLDGTLLEHDTYSIEPAREVLQEIEVRNLPLVFNSSKTRAEIENLQQGLEIYKPFACENGAALYERDSNEQLHLAAQFGSRRSDWLADIHLLRHELNLNFEGFEDWTTTQVSNITNLSEKESGLAKQREFSEPIHWKDSDQALTEFKQILNSKKLQLVEGGRFHSIQGRYSKRSPIDWLRTERGFKDAIIIALGDSPNDSQMFEAAHIAAVISSAKSPALTPTLPVHTVYSESPGPTGWAEAMHSIFKLIDSEQLNLFQG